MLERAFRTKTVHQGYIEPHNGTAWWTGDGRLTHLVQQPGHFGVRDKRRRAAGHPRLERKRSCPWRSGGGFGGKLAVYLEPLAAVLSKKTGCPVKLTMDRTEVLEASGPTSGSYMKMKVGVTQEGRITAAQAFFAFEAGAFPGAPLAGPPLRSSLPTT